MVSDGSWILWTSSKQCFHGCNLILGNKKKSGDQIQWVRTLGDLHYVFSSQNSCCWFCLSVSSQGTNFTKIHHMFNSSLRIHWYFQSERPNWLMISEMVLCWSFLRLCEVSQHLHLCGLWMGTWVLTVINQILPMHESRNLLKCLHYFHGIVTNSCFEYFVHCWRHSRKFEATRYPSLFFPSLENIRSYLTLHRSEHPLRSSTQVCGCKAH